MRPFSRRVTRLAASAVVALAGAALVAGPAQASPSAADPHFPVTAHGVVFVQTDDTTGNAIVVYNRGADGSLHPSGTFATGGNGGVLTGSVVDHLASQGSLVYDRPSHTLYAVNASSNTITVFDVRGDRLARRQVLSSGGTFPVSLTVHGHRVYALNARDGGSIQGYVWVRGTLVRVPSWHRALGLDPTLAPEFTHTPGQVAFTPDGSKILVTTKANTNAIDVYDIDAYGRPSAHPVVNVEPGTVPFGVTFDAHGHLVVAEAGPNAVETFTLHHNGSLTSLDSALTGQAATCWVATDGTHFYASNAGSASVSGYRDNATGSLHALGNTTTNPGTVDATVTPDGRYLYVQTGANGIVDGFRIGSDGALVTVGSVTVPSAVGGEGIATS